MVEIKGHDINNKERGVVISITLAIFFIVNSIKDGIPIAAIIVISLFLLSLPTVFKRNNNKFLKSVIHSTILIFIYFIIGIIIQMFAEGIGLVN